MTSSFSDFRIENGEATKLGIGIGILDLSNFISVRGISQIGLRNFINRARGSLISFVEFKN